MIFDIEMNNTLLRIEWINNAPVFVYRERCIKCGKKFEFKVKRVDQRCICVECRK